MEISRGDLVTTVLAGEYGKPRPVLVVQSDAFSELTSLTVLPLTSDLHDWPLFRVTVEPNRQNGLQTLSQIMIDKAATVPHRKIGKRVGQLDSRTMRATDIALARFLGLV